MTSCTRSKTDGAIWASSPSQSEVLRDSIKRNLRTFEIPRPPKILRRVQNLAVQEFARERSRDLDEADKERKEGRGTVSRPTDVKDG